MGELSLELIQEASAFLRGRIRKTPIEESEELSRLMGVRILLKLEFLQLTGSFKIRGALFKLSRLEKTHASSGVATCSAGNHGWALAYAGKRLGVPVTVYLPARVDPSKKGGIEALGAEVVQADSPGYDETERFAKEDARARGLPFVSPFDDYEIMAGNGGSLAEEIREQLGDVEYLVTPVGGGGLAAGLCGFSRLQRWGARLIGCQHAESPALELSIRRHRAVTALPPINTLAGGIEGGIGAKTFPIIADAVEQVALLSEEQIKEGVRWMLKHHHYLIEPSSAVTIAACLYGKLRLEGSAVLILTGRNIDFDSLQAVLTG